jgi:hypothetical protein
MTHRGDVDKPLRHDCKLVTQNGETKGIRRKSGVGRSDPVLLDVWL